MGKWVEFVRSQLYTHMPKRWRICLQIKKIDVSHFNVHAFSIFDVGAADVFGGGHIYTCL